MAAVAAPLAPRPAPRPAGAPGGQGSVRVKPGDTLGGIAQQVRPEGVSLDQMLVALFRANPQAFIGSNLNLVKAGAVLEVPGAEQIAAVSPREARSLIVAQSADFAAYRSRLASAVPGAVEAAPSRQAGGRIEAAVQDRKEAAAPGGDRLKLSQGAVRPGAQEAQVSREAAARDSATRVAELSRNVEELRRLQGAASAARPGAAVTPPKGPAAPAQAPVPAVPPAPPGPAKGPVAPVQVPVVPAPVKPPVAPSPAAAVPPVVIPPDRRPDPEEPLVLKGAPASAVASGASAPASVPAPAPAAAPAVKRVPAPPPPVQEPGFLSSLSADSPLLLPGAGALLALLLGYGAWRLRGRFGRRSAAGDSAAFGESRLQRDSFFGGTGGGRVDTQEGMSRQQGSSIGYSLSQLDAIGDVDPVAEADVYLAYGRDLQAEEILKEALRAHPDRLAVKTKLTEVYAKRRDVQSHEMLAAQVYAATEGRGDEWLKVQEQGRAIDPDNPMYQPGGQPGPDLAAADSQLDPAVAPPAVRAGADMEPSVFPERAGAADAGGDFDLDLDLGGPAPAAARPPARGATAARMAPEPAEVPPLDFDLNAISLDITGPAGPAAGAAAPDLDLSEPVSAAFTPGRPALSQVPEPPGLPELDFNLELPASAPSAAPRPGGRAESESTTPPSWIPAPEPVEPMPEMRPESEFELPDAPAPGIEAGADGDPLARKIELAEEFQQIGDEEGARELLREVLAQAEGELKAKAQALLERLG